MPDGKPPFADPDQFDMENQLDRIARLIYSERSGIAQADLDTWFEANPACREEFNQVKDSLRRPSTWLDGGVRVFDVTESPEGEFVDRSGKRYAVVNNYTLHYVPNRKRQTIAPWAAFGQRKD